ncbi:MAG: hypothetical protein V4436_02030 [Patescibacteria group bacterium]
MSKEQISKDEQERIRAVAKQIQDILVTNKMVMTPNISIGLVEEPPLDLTGKEKGSILTPEAIAKQESENPLLQADFMQP